MTLWQTRLPATPTTAQAVAWAESQLVQHSSYTKVKQITSSTTVIADIWKCAGATADNDWYFAFIRINSQATVIYMVAFEKFDSTNDTFMRGCPKPTITTPPAADFSLGGSTPQALFPTAGNLNTDLFIQPILIVSSGQTTDLWLVATKTNVAFTAFPTSSSAQMHYVGLFDSFVTGEPFPLVLATAGLGGSVSRFPFVTTGQAGNWSLGGNPATFTTPWSLQTGAINGSGDRFHNARPIASRPLVRHTGTTAAQAQQYGALRGLFKDSLVVSGQGTIGDTYVINGAQYVVMSNSGSTFLMATAAP